MVSNRVLRNDVMSWDPNGSGYVIYDDPHTHRTLYLADFSEETVVVREAKDNPDPPIFDKMGNVVNDPPYTEKEEKATVLHFIDSKAPIKRTSDLLNTLKDNINPVFITFSLPKDTYTSIHPLYEYYCDKRKDVPIVGMID